MPHSPPDASGVSAPRGASGSGAALVGAYVAVVPALQEPFVRRVATSLLAVEARHAAFFNGQTRAPVFPRLREDPASRVAARLVIERYRAR
jgi:hypothetical protein